MSKKNVAILGKQGQLAKELQQMFQACSLEFGELYVWGRESCDLLQKNKAILAKLLAQHQIDILINAAAYTAVDQAELAEEGKAVFQLNAYVVEMIAELCHELGIFLIHISTDFVFDGQASQPYCVTGKTNPQSVYGKSKALGEERLFKAYPKACCLRVSWLYSQYGSNFVKTMLQLMNERPQLTIVDDQIGSPTWAHDAAKFVVYLAQLKQSALEEKVEGEILHWSDLGLCSWYDFAAAIKLLAQGKGLLKSECKLLPISSSDYPTAAMRPAYSVLDKSQILTLFECKPSHWLVSLDQMLDQVAVK